MYGPEILLHLFISTSKTFKTQIQILCIGFLGLQLIKKNRSDHLKLPQYTLKQRILEIPWYSWRRNFSSQQKRQLCLVLYVNKIWAIGRYYFLLYYHQQDKIIHVPSCLFLSHLYYYYLNNSRQCTYLIPSSSFFPQNISPVGWVGLREWLAQVQIIADLFTKNVRKWEFTTFHISYQNH